MPRSTEVYVELTRMLWHPVSLHDQPAAVARTTHLLTASSMPGAPDDPAVVAAEVAELLDGDVPFFTTTPARGQLDGPAGTTWLPETDLIAEALRRWRATDLPLERNVIQSALVSAYLNDGWMPDDEPMAVAAPRLDGLDQRRRAQAASLMRQVVTAAIRAEDGTATWIAPVLNPTGWAVQPLSPDVYGGAPGVAVLLAAYLRETAGGRADPVAGLPELLAATLRTVRRFEDRTDTDRRAGVNLRPSAPGGYIGLGSQIWAWLTLERLTVAGDPGIDGLADDAVERARALAVLVPEAVAADETFDLLIGMAGAIVPLLSLARRTGEGRSVDTAAAIGDRLVEAAVDPGRFDPAHAGAACWPTALWRVGLGGFAHGSTGIGWALHRLADVTGDRRVTATAEAALRYDDRLYDPAEAGWRDVREPEGTAAAWCHGAVGIGMAAADLSAP